MSVAFQRPSAFDGNHLWTNMPPPYVGGGGHYYSVPQQQQQPHLHAYAAPQAFHPGFGTPFHSSPADAYYAQQQFQQQQQQQQQQSFSRHAFASSTPFPGFGYDQFGMAPPPYHANSDSYSSQSQHAASHQERSQSHGRWPSAPTPPSQGHAFGRSSWEATEHPGVIGGGIWRDNSLDGRTGAAYSNSGSLQTDYDHPSFERPPHRSNSVESAPAPVVVSQPQQLVAPVTTSSNDQVEYNLIPNISPVPPPPTLERSAVPLADLATEMVWEAVALGVDAENARSPSMPARWANSLSTKAPALFNEIDSVQDEMATSPRPFASSPHTPELFGAIGDGRSRKVSRMSLDDGYGSDESSPSSSAPGTPADEPAFENAAARRQRLAGLGLGFGYGAMDGKVDHEEVLRDGLASPVEAIRTHARNLGPKAAALSQPASVSFPAEPTPAFRQFVKQVLTATLLAPEDLALALYYVARIPSGSIIPPTQPEQGSGVSAVACAIKAAPFKIMLGALMLANKTLQDNSYRNETFAAVSGIPLKDVNDLEVFVFGALGFDVAVREDVWQPWLDTMVERSHAGRGQIGNRAEVSSTLQRLMRAALRNAAATVPSSPVIEVIERPSTPVNHSLIAEVNLDASGPLESPLQFDRNAHFAVAAESPTRHSFGQDRKVTSMFPISHSRSFGDEKRQHLQC